MQSTKRHRCSKKTQKGTVNNSWQAGSTIRDLYSVELNDSHLRRPNARKINSAVNSFSGIFHIFNPLSANPEKWSNTLKQIVDNLPTICLSVFDHFMNLALKGLRRIFE